MPRELTRMLPGCGLAGGEFVGRKFVGGELAGRELERFEHAFQLPAEADADGVAALVEFGTDFVPEVAFEPAIEHASESWDEAGADGVEKVLRRDEFTGRCFAADGKAVPEVGVFASEGGFDGRSTAGAFAAGDADHLVPRHGSQEVVEVGFPLDLELSTLEAGDDAGEDGLSDIRFIADAMEGVGPQHPAGLGGDEGAIGADEAIGGGEITLPNSPQLRFKSQSGHTHQPGRGHGSEGGGAERQHSVPRHRDRCGRGSGRAAANTTRREGSEHGRGRSRRDTVADRHSRIPARTRPHPEEIHGIRKSGQKSNKIGGTRTNFAEPESVPVTLRTPTKEPAPPLVNRATSRTPRPGTNNTTTPGRGEDLPGVVGWVKIEPRFPEARQVKREARISSSTSRRHQQRLSTTLEETRNYDSFARDHSSPGVSFRRRMTKPAPTNRPTTARLQVLGSGTPASASTWNPNDE